MKVGHLPQPPIELVGSNEGRAADPVKAEKPPKTVAKPASTGTCPARPTLGCRLDEERHANRRQKSGGRPENSTCKNVGSPPRRPRQARVHRDSHQGIAQPACAPPCQSVALPRRPRSRIGLASHRAPNPGTRARRSPAPRPVRKAVSQGPQAALSDHAGPHPGASLNRPSP